MIDAHHHLWDLNKVSYPWLEAEGVVRFFGDPTPIQRNYLLTEFRESAVVEGFRASVHIQVGATDPVGEAEWIDSIAQANPDWPLVQVVYCDLTSKSLDKELDLGHFQVMSDMQSHHHLRLCNVHNSLLHPFVLDF